MKNKFCCYIKHAHLEAFLVERLSLFSEEYGVRNLFPAVGLAVHNFMPSLIHRFPFHWTCCRGNMLGTNFTIFDSGDSPKSTRMVLPDGGNLRREIAAVSYVST